MGTKEKSGKTVKKGRRILSIRGEEIKRKRTMRFWFSSIVWVLFAITALSTAAIFTVLSIILSVNNIALNAFLLIAATTISSLAIGFVLAALAPKFIFHRLTRISEGMREVARGNFKTRVNEGDKDGALSEFGELERSFNHMASDLESIEIFRNDFINNFSHEFKTPIVSLRGFARQLQSGNLTEEQKKEYLNIIVSESERLANMSNNVLLLSKLETQTIVTDKTSFSLDEQIRGCVLLLEKEWGDKNIELDIELDDTDYYFNEEMLSHVWINLLSNAIKFSDNGGTISLRLYQKDTVTVFEISDNGTGMSEETKERIFEKFFQGDTSHATRGNGIGLNIVKRILTLANGSVTVESELDKGSKFTVTLPADI